MKNEEFSVNNRKRRPNWRRKTLLLASLLALLLGVIGGSLAYLIDNEDPLENVFTPGKVDITVDEDFKGEVKNNVKITLSPDSVNARIRAMVIVTWQNDQGEVYPNAPIEGTHYEITWTKDGWTGTGIGWYTYSSTVTPGNSTGVLFTACKPLVNCPDSSYKLVVDVIAEAIQADGGAGW